MNCINPAHEHMNWVLTVYELDLDCTRIPLDLVLSSGERLEHHRFSGLVLKCPESSMFNVSMLLALKLDLLI